MASHRAGCPGHNDADATCICEALEDRMIALASRPSPAELIRRAMERGLITSATEYV